MNNKYKSQLSFFDHSRRMEKIEEFDRLPAIKELVPWESFRGILEDGTRKGSDERLGGRPRFDSVKMFRVLVLQKLYNLSDEALEFRINDSLSFQRFVGIGPNEIVPDAKTIWLYREQLSRSEIAIERLFSSFEKYLSAKGFKATGGTILDASIVRVPEKKVGSNSDYQQIKRGETPDSWKGNESQRRQLDPDARFTNRRGVSLYGYKNHISVDVKYKLIRQTTVTDAARHESLVVEKLLNKRNRSKAVYGDPAYDTHRVGDLLTGLGLRSEIQKQRRSESMPEDKYTKYNSKRSPIRKRIEHVFGHQATSMKANIIRCVGMVRARTSIILANMVYNMSRLRFLQAEYA